MRTHRRRAALAAALITAGGSLVVTGATTSAFGDHLNYVPPTEYEAQHPEVNESAPPAEESEAPQYSYADSGLAESMAAIRSCESNNDYGANTGNGYYGAYQFSATTWSWLGYGGWPHEAPPSVQDEAAVALYNIYGWTPWPSCARMLGLL